MRLLAASLVLFALPASALADHYQRGGWRHRRPPPLDMSRLVSLTNACNDAMEGQPNEQACLATVSRSRRSDLEATIRACEDAMEGDTNELACIGTMARSWLNVTAVRACEDAMEGDGNELACLDAVQYTRYEPAELVRYCEQNYNGDDAELACIKQW